MAGYGVVALVWDRLRPCATPPDRFRARDFQATTVSALTSLSYLLFRTAVRLPFVCLSKRKEAKEKTPGTAPATPVHSDAQRRRDAAKTRIALAMLKQLAAPALCAGHPSPLRLSVAVQRGLNASGASRASSSQRLSRFVYGLCLRSCRIAPSAKPIQRKVREGDLERAIASLPVFNPLAKRRAAQHGRG